MSDDYDPFNDPSTAHARAREMLLEPFFWDCVDEETPFGSDEGHDAYFEYRRWRAANPSAPLVKCLSWIMAGRVDEYTEGLCSDERIASDLENPEDAFLAEDYEMFTLDATVIATALGQLIDEGRIDEDAKPYIRVAIKRQMHPSVVTSEHRAAILRATQRVVDAA